MRFEAESKMLAKMFDEQQNQTHSGWAPKNNISNTQKVVAAYVNKNNTDLTFLDKRVGKNFRRKIQTSQGTRQQH